MAVPAESPETLARLADLNLSPAELASFRRKFDVIDINKDGAITLRELFTISRVFGYKFTVEELTDIFGDRYSESAGGITFVDFVRAMIARRDHNRRFGSVKAKFQMFDPKRKGHVTAETALPILKQWLGFDLNKTESFLDLFDKNRDYKLSMKEFIPFYQRVEELKMEVETAFKFYDKNSNGYVDFEEAKEILTEKGYSEEQVREYFQRHDLNGDGRLDYAEFTSFYDVPIFAR